MCCQIGSNKNPTPENKKFPGLQMPAQPGRQPAASWSMGRSASRPGSHAAAQPARQATFGLASEQPAGRRAGPLARRAARQLPARGQPVQTPQDLRLLFYTGIRHFSETVIPKQPVPGQKKAREKPHPTNWTTVQACRQPTGWPGSGHPTSWPAVFSILSLLGSTGGGFLGFFCYLARNPGNHI